MKANAVQNARAGVHGHANAILEGNVNLSANDGSVTRFGWKAQNKSLLMFAGEAYNVEMGISNQLFPQERDETASCRPYNYTPEDTNNFSPPATETPTAILSDIEAFADFMRMLAPPVPAAPTPRRSMGGRYSSRWAARPATRHRSRRGQPLRRGSSRTPSPALSGQPVNLYSDLLVHHMGQGLADGDHPGRGRPR